MAGDWKDQLSKRADSMGLKSQEPQEPPKEKLPQNQHQQAQRPQQQPLQPLQREPISRPEPPLSPQAHSPVSTTNPSQSQQDYVSEAETVILGLRRVDRFGNQTINLTTSQLRNFLSLANQIYNEVILNTEDQLSQPIQDRIKYLRVRIVYDAGRDTRGVVKEFVNKARLLEKIEGIGNSRKKFLEFSRYMEALVAYHRFYGGND